MFERIQIFCELGKEAKERDDRDWIEDMNYTDERGNTDSIRYPNNCLICNSNFDYCQHCLFVLFYRAHLHCTPKVDEGKGAGLFNLVVAIIMHQIKMWFYCNSLPVGSVLVLNGNGADVSKHCVPAVPTKRISITFRKMDESKWPIGFLPEPDLQGLQPLSYETNRSKRHTPLKPKLSMSRQVVRREDNNRDKARGSAGRGNYHVEPQVSLQIQRGPSNRRRVSVNLDG
ncbi:RNA demethylase ALKBH9B [Camellia lanceoleosa]|uniref:RNA demethylase ALKBH9B n=1 Tax=Camellia lanceoleosa TaxID=1840588 RepID=A0ACC0I087_9ERIC|nr:RNA demethylase ALKBH9B [Camellia lanceoleosa]